MNETTKAAHPPVSPLDEALRLLQSVHTPLEVNLLRDAASLRYEVLALVQHGEGITQTLRDSAERLVNSRTSDAADSHLDAFQRTLKAMRSMLSRGNRAAEGFRRGRFAFNPRRRS